MKNILLLITLSFILVSCGNDNKTGNTTSDTTTTESMTDKTGQTGQNHMRDLHDAMDKMMQDMKNMEHSGDADYDYATMMKRHHQGSIEMAKVQIDGGSDQQLKDLSEKMINEQQSEIEKLDSFIQKNKPVGNSGYGQKAMDLMTPMGNIKMDGSSLDAMFVSMIIPHHQDAVSMSQEYLKVAKNDDIKRIASKLIESQPKEISELQNWNGNH